MGGAASVTVSIGVVTLDGSTGERDIDALVAADDAMYRAKRAGSQPHLARRVERPVAVSTDVQAGATGLEPATSGVTGRRSNQLNYAPAGRQV